jgi:hypothetical protein
MSWLRTFIALMIDTRRIAVLSYRRGRIVVVSSLSFAAENGSPGWEQDKPQQEKRRL